MELEKKLAELKSALEENLKKHASTEIAEQLKEMNEKLSAIEVGAKGADDDKIKSLENEIADLKGELAASVKSIEILAVRVKNAKPETPAQPMTFEKAISEAIEEKHDDIQKFTRGETKKLSIEVKAVADQSTANITGGSVWGSIYKPGIIMDPNQIGHIRQWMTPIQAGPGTDYYFMRENGGEGAPAPTSEKKAAAATTQATGLKPQFDRDLVESSVKFETIAGFMVVSRKAMNNIPGFTQYLNTRLPEMLLDVEDANILYGDGNSPNIKGIFTTGNHTAATSTATVFAEMLIDGISQLEDSEKRSASAIWVRPADYWDLFKNKAIGGSEEYDLPQNLVFANGQLYISGVPVYKTTALNAGDYMIGAAGGADLMVQGGIMLEFFNQDGTNVRTNQVTVRVEETIAMPVYGDNYFIVGSNLS